ncbi:MAG: ATP-binding protein [Janthinobacterium lividum]
MPDNDQSADSSPSATEDTGVPAQGEMTEGGIEPLGRPSFRHWKQATVVDGSLDVRNNVFFAAIEMTRMPMVLADPRQNDCPLVFSNNAFLDLTGYEIEEVIGRNCRFLQGAGTDPAAVQKLREAIAEATPIALEILNYRRDGTPFWNAIFMGPVFDQEGTLIYFFASQLDVSKRRESENALRQAQKMESIGQLTAGLAHDFNNLLQVVNGSLERMQIKRHDDAAFARHHTAATSATARAAKLTQQLLAFARRTRLEPSNIDMSALVTSFGELLETSVGRHAELHLSLQRRLPLIRVDPNQLEMALLNIVVNARDASPIGGSVTVRTKLVGTLVQLSVTDEGPGMLPHVKARATEPFFTTKGLGKGTGLGLAMAQGFAQQSGGRLEIDSEPGKGTTVRLLFPVAPDAADSTVKPLGYQTQPVDSPNAPLILVVDDSHEIADVAQETLTDAGYRVAVAYSAEEALVLFEAAKEAGDGFTLVFSDMLMPGGANGIVLAERVRERDKTCVVLLTTGYHDELLQTSPIGLGLEVLGKPYRPSELVDRVQAGLKQGARAGPGRQRSDFGHARE